MAASAPTPARPNSWTILVVPARTDKRTRAFRLKKRYLKLAGAIVGLFLFAVSAVIVLGELDQDETLAELADAQWVIQSLSDSLNRMSGGGVVQAGSPVGDAPAGVALRPAARRVARPRPRGIMGLAAPAPGVVMPVIGRITSRFTRSRFHPLLHIFRPHLGVDITAPAGTAITAPAAGRVSFAGRKFGDGLTVDIDHGDGIVSRYGHCKKILVKEGEVVTAGTVIATVGSTGLATGPHVHFEVRVNGKPVDPMSIVLQNRAPGALAGEHQDPGEGPAAQQARPEPQQPKPDTQPQAAQPQPSQGTSPSQPAGQPQSSPPSSQDTLRLQLTPVLPSGPPR